jgi:hypothetical protein
MSTKYPGGIISKTAPVPTGPYENGTAPGVWTLEQQAEFVRQGIWPIAGNVPNYIEDVFSTFLYTGTGPNRTITNGIDLAGKGGLVWIKARSGLAEDNLLSDTARGVNRLILSSSTSAQIFVNSDFFLKSFNSDGFTYGNGDGSAVGTTYASWTFRKQPKFFDVVTWTGSGANRTIAHNLGSVPGCIMVKRTDAPADWQVYHHSNTAAPATDYLVLNSTAATVDSNTRWNDTLPTDTLFSLGTDATVNASGGTYVAYLFAHNAGGFGLTGTDNVISCGSLTTDGSGNATVNLGYEPQFVIFKSANVAGGWRIHDVMRGWNNSGNDALLIANGANAESFFDYGAPTATGFNTNGGGFDSSQTYIYIAIRRGPMKVPTTGTSVFSPAYTSSNQRITTNFPVDLQMGQFTGGGANYAVSRLQGMSTSTTGSMQFLATSSTAAESANTGSIGFNGFDNTGFSHTLGNFPQRLWSLRRAPGFFDVICWTGDGTNPRSLSHNLTVAPTLIITKKRNSTSNWITGYDFASTTYKYFNLNDTGAANADTYASTPVYGGNPTASVFIVGNQGNINQSGDTYVSYLFASCPGVSKVGSFTGTGATQVINCGFTGGARFVLIKATSTTGDWLVWDSARGIVAGNDPYLAMNSTAAEVTSTDWVDTASTGFELSNAGGNLANSSGVSYIFLAIA